MTITETYLKSGGNTCPLCKNTNIVGGNVDWMNGMTGFRNVRCIKCKAEFVEEIRVVGIEIAEQEVHNMNRHEATVEFNQAVMPAVRKMYELDGKPDYIARREAWNNFTDALCKDGKITSKQYETWGHPQVCLRHGERN